MNHDHLSTLAELYALDVLDSTELESFHSHLSAGCPECEKIIGQTREDLSRAAFSLQPKLPNPAIKAALMEQISVIPLGSRLKQWWPLGAFAGAALLMSLIPMSMGLLGESKSGDIHDKEMLQILSSDRLQKIALSGSKIDENALAKLAWNSNACGGCLVIENLESLSQGQVYQVWATQDSKAPVSLGIFTVDENGKAHMDIKGKTQALNFQSFAITKEPAGGVLSPTGAVYLSGKF